MAMQVIEKNARFWTLGKRANLVKLTLKPRQSLSWGWSSVDEEGWSSFAETFTHEGDSVRLDYGSDGRDCDGRFRQGGTAFCSLERLRSLPCHGLESPEMVPDWIDEDRWQRDDAAEAMNY